MLCLPDLFIFATEPIHALAERETVNHWPTSLVFSIHMYHMLFFRNLDFIDWLHHILMVVIGAPLLITGEVRAAHGPPAPHHSFAAASVENFSPEQPPGNDPMLVSEQQCRFVRWFQPDTIAPWQSETLLAPGDAE